MGQAGFLENIMQNQYVIVEVLFYRKRLRDLCPFARMPASLAAYRIQ
jgi:hypothetical protein